MAGNASNNAAAAFAAKLALRTRMNNDSMVAFALAIACLTAVFIIFHLLRVIGRRTGPESRPAKNPSFPVVISRKVRALLLRTSPGLPSTGHALMTLSYFTINVVILFTNHDNNNMTLHANIASRTGWLAMVNMLIVAILALKNTPLAFLTAWSYERLNILHQIAGYLTVIFVIIHACSYASYFGMQNHLSRLTEIDEIYGMVAGFSFLILAISGGIIRRWSYEVFYYLHVGFWVVAIIMTGMHQPEWSRNILCITIVAAGIWALDRLIRLVRLVVYSSNNSVTLTPLPNGGTRVVLKKAPVGAVSGKHCFLWIPGVRAFETHPFTIAAMNPLEFVVASYDGFTCDLHKYAVQHPGVSLKASVEGSYGTFPDPMDHDKVVLIAGGSGASFTFGMALSMLKRMTSGEAKKIVFIWIIKQKSYLAWFAEHLQTLKSNTQISIHVYITRPSPSTPTSPISDMEKPSLSDLSALRPTIVTAADIEKASSSTTPSGSDAEIPSPNMTTAYERPDVAELIRAAIEETPTDNRVLVMGCGPDNLMSLVRDTTAGCIRRNGPGVELHCEQFGW